MNVTTHTRSSSGSNWPRAINIILGIWLFISAFAWPHSNAQMINTAIIGVLAVIFALLASYSVPQARFVDTLLAIWLFISAFALPSISPGTIWNNVIVAIVMFAVSLVPSGTEGRQLRRAHV
jgi:hypothetical protein